MPKTYRKPQRKYRYRRRYRKISPIKRLVTGQTEPTMLEKISSFAGPVATVAKAVLPMIRMINTEVKFIDTATSDAVSDTVTFQSYNGVAQGTDESNRIGNSILAKDWNIRIRGRTNHTTTPYNYIRFVMFVDRFTTGSSPTAAQLFQDTARPTISAFHKDYTDRFSILKDKRFTISAQSTATASVGFSFKVYKKLDFHIRYTAGTSSVGSYGPNSLWIAIITGNPTADTIAFDTYSRVNFTDN